jgi:uncharacterized membrane protein (DUF2068 family)
MTDPSTPDAGAQLRDAAMVQNRTRAATGRFAGYALLMGLAAFALWQSGQSAGWWIVAAAALASPFPVVAWTGWTGRRRS